MKVSTWGALALACFVSACTVTHVPPYNPPPPLPLSIVERVIVRGPDGVAVPGAHVILSDDSGGVWTADTNDAGEAAFTLPWSARGTGGSWWASAPNFGSTEGRVLFGLGVDNRFVVNDTEGADIQLNSPHRDPWSFSDEQVRAIRTNLSGVYINEIKPQCPVDPQTGIRCQADNGATPRGLVEGAFFTANYRIYTAEQRQIIRDVFTGKRPDARGITHHYTHMTISLFCRDIPDYHGVYPPCASAAKVGVNEALRELYDNDPPLIPIGFAMHDDEPNDLGTPLSIDGVVDPDLIRLVEPYWEHFEVSCATVKVHRYFPRARVYYHNPNGTDAPYGDACFPGNTNPDNYPGAGAVYAWLRANTDGMFTGILLQTEEQDHNDLIGRIADFVASFSNGPRVARVGGGWPSGLDTVHFEELNSVYQNFWGGGDSAALLERVNAVNKFVTTPLCEDGNTRAVVPSSAWCGFLAGFGSGGVAAR